MRKIVLLSILLLFFLSMSAVSAANPQNQDIYVSVTGNDSSTGEVSSPYATIGKAVNVSDENNNVKIHLGEGNFNGNGNVNVTINKNHSTGGSLTFIGEGINKTFIDGGKVNWLINIGSSTVNLINVTFIDGKTSSGGAIANKGILSIYNCSFEGNNATSSGGAVYSESGSLAVSGSFFNNNYATSNGGAIGSYSLCNISDSIFVNNSGRSGGSVYVSSSSDTYSSIINSTFTNSTATRYGGSLYISYASIVNNTFEESKTTDAGTSYGGGAIYGGNLYLKNNDMIFCSAESKSGHYIKANGLINNSLVTINSNIITRPTFTLTANVTDDKGNPIDGGNIAFYANSTSLGSANVVNGVATLNVNELLANGIYILNGVASNYYTNITNGTLNVNINIDPSTYYVSPAGDDDLNDGLTISTPFKTIQKAIDLGFANGIYVNIYLLNGTYQGTGNVNLNLTTYLGTLNIEGLNYNQTIIDGNGSNSLFNFGSNIKANLENLTVRNFNNSAASGAIILSTGTNMGSANPKYEKISILNCIFENNALARNGAVVRLISGSIENSQFIHNAGTSLYIATGYGTDDLVLVNNTSFINNTINTTTSSYGVAYLGNSIRLENSVFINNSVYGTYGLIYFNTNQVCETKNNQFTNNTNLYDGGFIFRSNSQQTSYNNTFEGNTATYVSGGGTYINNIFKNNQLRGNKAIFYLSNAQDQLNITDCTFTDNNITSVILLGNNRGTILNNVTLRFESLNSTSLKNDLRAILDFPGITVTGGSVNFYLDGIFLGTASFVNNVAEIKDVAGFGNGVYQITGNNSNFANVITQNGTLNITSEVYDSLTYYVGQNGSDSNGDGSVNNPYATIKKAIDEGALKTFNLIINILPGTIKGTGNVKLTLPNYLNITIAGTGNQTIIDGDGENWLFKTDTFLENGQITIANLTVRNAKAEKIFSGSGSGSGQGIIQAAGNLKIENCIFEDNIGYVISCDEGAYLYVNNSTFKRNINTIHSYYGNYISITNSTFEDNSALNNAAWTGGKSIIYIKDRYRPNSSSPVYEISSVFIDNITIRGSTGDDYSYGLFIEGCNSTILNSNFSNNNLTALSVFAGAANNLTNIYILNNCYFNNNTYDIATLFGPKEGPRPNISLLGCVFNESGAFTIIDSRYQNVIWTVINSSFINMKNNITFQSGGWVNGIDYGESILDGNFFKNNSGIVIGGSANITNCVIFDDLFIYKGAFPASNPIVNLNYNYWGGNPNVTALDTSTTIILDYWIIPKLVADGKAGLSQVVSLVYKAFDGTNYHDYNVSSVPIPAEGFTYVVGDGNISPVSGNLTKNGFDAVYTVAGYGVKTVIANFANGDHLSLDVDFHNDSTNTTVSLSKPIGENGDYVDVTVDVTGEDGSPVNEGLVEFFLNGNSLGTVGVVNGRATKSIKVTGLSGPYEIYAEYLGTERFGGSNGVEIYQLIDTVAPSVSVNRAGGTYTNVQNVTLTSDDPTAVIYYTTDGSTPTVNSAVYSGPIRVSSNMTLKYFAVDPAGNSSQIYSQSYVIDTVAPKVSKLDPAKNAVVKSAKTIKITFNEAVKAGSFWIDLKNSSGKLIPFTTNISGNTLTITPKSVLSSDKYNLDIHTGAITDLAGNALGIYSTSFTVDTVAPKVSKVDPANGATKVAAGKTVKVTFNEAIKVGSKFWVDLKNSSGKMISFKYSISGKVLTIDPKSNLAESLYTLTIHTGAVTDLAGNPVALKSSRFSVGTAPKVSKVDPKSGATKVAAGKTVKVTFNEAIKVGSKFWVDLKNSSGKMIPFKYSISGKVLTIKPKSKLTESLYTLTIHTGAVTDLAGNPVALKSSKFSVGTEPKVSKVDPKNGATKVARNKTIKVTFNEAIKKGSNFKVELKTSKGKSVKITKSISGKVLTIKHAKLAANTKYKLVLYTGSVTDKAGNPLAAKTYTFTTGKT